MKKTFTLLLLVICFRSLAQVPTPTLNFGLTSHNEMVASEPYDTAPTYTFFNQTRDTLRKIVDMVMAKNAKYNLQSCQKFILGSIHSESAAITSTDILEYAYKLGGAPYGNVVEIDARTKTMTPTYTYNIADVAHLIDSTGATCSKNLGGFVYIPYPGDWMPYTTTVTGVFNKPWKADILWGAGTGSPLTIHSQDANNFGSWKPKSNTDSLNFYCHDPSKTYWAQGNGCAWDLDAAANTTTLIADIRNVATKIKNGTYPANKWYNATMMINFRDFSSANFRVKLTLVIDSINVMVGQGLINWKTISQKHTAFLAWSSANSIPYSQWRCGQTTTLAPTCAPSGFAENSVHDDFLLMAPNPAHNEVLITWGGQMNDHTFLQVYDPLGRKILEEKMNVSIAKIATENYPPGIYTILMQNDAGQSKPMKLIVSH